MAKQKTARTRRSSKLPDLSEVVAKELADLGVSKTELARRIGEKPDSLRGWLGQNSYPQDVVDKLSRELRLNIDAEAYEYTTKRHRARHRDSDGTRIDFSSASLADLIRAHWSGCTGESGAVQDRIPAIENFFDAMHESDLFLMLCTNTLPRELDETHWDRLGSRLCRALSRGAFFVYLWPDSEVVARYRDSTNLPFPGFEFFETTFLNFREVVERRLEKAGSDPGLATTNLHGIRCGLHGICAPEHKYCLYRSADPDDLLHGAFGLIPTGDLEDDSFTNCSFGHSFTAAFIHFVRTALSAGSEDLFDRVWRSTRGS